MKQKKYQINLLEKHFDVLVDALHQEPRLLDFILVQKKMHDKSRELSELSELYEKTFDQFDAFPAGKMNSNGSYTSQ